MYSLERGGRGTASIIHRNMGGHRWGRLVGSVLFQFVLIFIRVVHEYGLKRQIILQRLLKQTQKAVFHSSPLPKFAEATT